MKHKSIIVVSVSVIVVGSTLFLAYFSLLFPFYSIVLWLKYPSVEIVGAVDYTGFPEPEGRPIHGYRYLIIPEASEMTILEGSGTDRVTLWGNRMGLLNPEYEGKKVMVRGIFIENYQRYLSETFQLAPSINPGGGAVILLRDIQIIE